MNDVSLNNVDYAEIGQRPKFRWLPYPCEYNLWMQRIGGYKPVFSGRAPPSELFLCAFLWIMLSIGTAYLALLVSFLLTGKGDSGSDSPFNVSWLVLVLLIPVLAAIIRRLHDTNRTAWALLVIITPYIGLVILAVILCLPGDEGYNDYGPNPRGLA